jgi:N-acetylglucosaminyldiphosphoundecaprenol N-acetyl-beta-D-mannosaminyltransferase
MSGGPGEHSRPAPSFMTTTPSTDAKGHTCGAPGRGPRVNGVRIDVLTWPGFFDRLDAFLECGRGHVLHYLAADPTVVARGEPAYRDLLNRGHLNLADGMPVAWATRILGTPTERISGIDSMGRVAEWGRSRDLAHFFYGGTEEVAAAVPEALAAATPGLRVVGAESPPFLSLPEWRTADLGDIAGRVRASGARAVWVGLGAPKQDVVGDRLAAVDAAPLVFCVGGAFEVVGGARAATPEWIRRAGFEWAHRLVSEPRRLWRRYLVGNPKFVAGLASDLLHGERARARRDAVGDG